MYCLELKSTSGKAISYAGSKPMIKAEQITALKRANVVGGAVAGFLVNYRTVGKTFWIPVWTLAGIMAVGKRMSLGIRDAETYGIRVPQRHLKVHDRYDLSVIWGE